MLSVTRHVQLLLKLYSKDSLYFRMPKVASATITQSLGPHTAILPHRYRPSTINFLLGLNSSSFKFTFVRHPYDRFASAYKWATRDVIDERTHPLDSPQREAILSFGSLENFCENLPSFLTDKSRHPIHFYPQTSYIWPDDKPLVDFIGRYEHLEEDCNKLMDLHEIELDVTFGANQKNANKGKEARPKNILSPETKRMLDEVYRKDFEALGYESQ